MALVWAGIAVAEEPLANTVVVSMAVPAVRQAARPAVPAFDQGQTLLAGGDVLGALEPFRTAVHEEVGSLRSLRSLGQALLLAGEQEEAEEVLLRAAHVEPNDLDTVELLAIARFQRGNTVGAASMFERVLRAQADRPASVLGAARCALADGQSERSLELTERAMALELPGAAELRLSALTQAGRRREARQLRRELRRSGQIGY